MVSPMRTALRTIVLITPLLFAVGSTPSAHACPACKDTVAGGDSSGGNPADPGGNPAGGGGLPGGFNTSVYVMLAAFLGTLGMVGVTLYRGARGPVTPRKPG